MSHTAAFDNPMTPNGSTAPSAVRIVFDDDVAVALRAIQPGESVDVNGARVVAKQEIPAGHKVALRHIQSEEAIRKYGVPIGLATTEIAAGEWIHSHNLRTQLAGTLNYTFHPQQKQASSGVSAGSLPAFRGYRRGDGRVGTRNELWVLNTVGCVNHAAERIARMASERFAGQVDGIHAFAHPYGCSQLGDDLRNTQRVLAGLIRQPNAGGVLILGLGCENNQLDALLALADPVDRARVKFFNTQDVIDELEQGTSAVAELVARVATDRRTDVPVSELVLGHKCGG
jgi:altronate hydrolase